MAAGRQAPPCAATAKYPTPVTLTPTYTDANYRYPGWLSDDGVEYWTYSQTVLWRSIDGWATTQTVYTFSLSVAGVRQTASGELLVSLQGDSGAPGELWLSSGYSRTTGLASSWSKVLTYSANNVHATGDWAMWVGGGVCLVGEYGSKLVGANGRYVYVSLDDGATWDIILDRPGVGLHIHGVAYDLYSDLVWVTGGDTSQYVAYSADWRNATPTWTTVSTTVQPVGIYPMEDRIVFGSDDTNNGPYRIERTDLATMVSAFDVTTDATLTVIGGQFYRRQHSPAYPLYLSYSRVPGQTGSGYVLGTWDGLRWWRLWSDTITYTGGGPLTSLGPDADGNISCFLYGDGRNASGTRLTLPAPTWRRV